MQRYVGNLVASDGENRNLASYSFESHDGKGAAIAWLAALARETMKN
jgi:hypothetical protein